MRSLFWTVLVPALLAGPFRDGAPSAPTPATVSGPSASPAAPVAPAFPAKEKLSFRIEWRLITAGTAELDLNPISPQTWETKVKLQSAGMVNRLYYVHDDYTVRTDRQFCAATSTLDAAEGKRRRLTTINYDPSQKKLHYQERDLVKSTTNTHDLEVAPCTHEIMGALAYLRTITLEPGKSIQIPVTDGKHFSQVRIAALERQKITVNGQTYSTVKYEALVFDNIIYQRKGTLNIWITDDQDRLPVQLRIGLGFPVYDIMATLEKREK